MAAITTNRKKKDKPTDFVCVVVFFIFGSMLSVLFELEEDWGMSRIWQVVLCVRERISRAVHRKRLREARRLGYPGYPSQVPQTLKVDAPSSKFSSHFLTTWANEPNIDRRRRLVLLRSCMRPVDVARTTLLKRYYFDQTRVGSLLMQVCAPTNTRTRRHALARDSSREGKLPKKSLRRDFECQGRIE